MTTVTINDEVYTVIGEIIHRDGNYLHFYTGNIVTKQWLSRSFGPGITGVWTDESTGTPVLLEDNGPMVVSYPYTLIKIGKDTWLFGPFQKNGETGRFKGTHFISI